MYDLKIACRKQPVESLIGGSILIRIKRLIFDRFNYSLVYYMIQWTTDKHTKLQNSSWLQTSQTLTLHDSVNQILMKCFFYR